MEQKKSKKILIIFSDFYPEVSKNLIDGAENYLNQNNFSFEKKKVDGSLEIPFLLHKFKNEFDGFIVLGCVIKGETDHYEIVKDICLNAVYSFAYKECIPLGCGILTVNNLEQAIERSYIKKKNLGQVAAIACCNLVKIIKD